ncbi:MAG TPA: translation initiation factor IF-2 [Bacteroidales bacterium]|nr:translation initiation factor IF-2 [Bacteroidales bacterium]
MSLLKNSKAVRLSKAAREFNIAVATIVDFLKKKGITVDRDPNARLEPEMYDMLVAEFDTERKVREEAEKIGLSYKEHENLSIETAPRRKPEEEEEGEELFIKQTGFSDKPVEEKKAKPAEAPKKAVEKPLEPVVEKVEAPAPPAPPAPEPEPLPAPVIQEVPAPVETVQAPPVVEPVAEKTEPAPEPEPEPEPESTPEPVQEGGLKVLGKIDLDSLGGKRSGKKSKKEAPAPEPAPVPAATTPEPEPVAVVPATTPEAPEITAAPAPAEAAAPETPAAPKEPQEDVNFLRTQVQKLSGPTIVGKMDLEELRKKERKPVASSSDDKLKAKKKRKRIRKPAEVVDDKAKKPVQGRKGPPRREEKPELTDEEIQRQIKETLANLTSKGSGKAKAMRKKVKKRAREEAAEAHALEMMSSTLKLTEFVTVSELASLMDVSPTEVIAKCMEMGLFVSINQRLDAETIQVVADEFGFDVEFIKADEADDHVFELDDDELLVARNPIVTVMGHVDHGKTKLLDHIRSTNVMGGEAGGITQHIGAYEVVLPDGRGITFLDTPGHEAFTAMRARGAKVTDIAIIIVAADDAVMPQTVEAINHAKAAGVPIVIAINKIDKPSANPEKIREQLANMNILVEQWGGKYQCQEISAKAGLNIELLLEKVLLEAEILDLKANPNRMAAGTTIESALDKGRGYVAKMLVQTGTLHVGDVMLAGSHFGRIKAMYNERNQQVKEAGPSSPVLVLGLNGAPQAGDVFMVKEDEREAKNVATKRQQLQREQGLRTKKHITLDEIGRRIAIGDFKELNVIVKGDVDGSVEALTDELLKLSTNEVQVNVIHKDVGAVKETDIMLASASNAVIVAFQVRPSVQARKLAEAEQIDIRMYSVIYDAVNEIKEAIAGMLTPKMVEKITCNIEVRDVFKITKVGTVAGCYVLDGKVNRHTKVRIIRDGIVVYSGLLGSLKRFKDDVKEVSAGYECGLNIHNFNDIKVGDIIEGYEEVEEIRK